MTPLARRLLTRSVGERVDMWIVAFGDGSGGDLFFGFGQMAYSEVLEVLAEEPHVVFFGGRCEAWVDRRCWNGLSPRSLRAPSAAGGDSGSQGWGGIAGTP
jgi:hypothetical protein